MISCKYMQLGHVMDSLTQIRGLQLLWVSSSKTGDILLCREAGYLVTKGASEIPAA